MGDPAGGEDVLENTGIEQGMVTEQARLSLSAVEGLVPLVVRDGSDLIGNKPPLHAPGKSFEALCRTQGGHGQLAVGGDVEAND